MSKRKRLKLQPGESFGEYAHRLLDAMDCPFRFRANAHKNLVDKLANRHLLKRIEKGEMHIVKAYSSYAYTEKGLK